MAWQRARRQFGVDYNGRLLTGLLVLAVCAIVVFRFVAPSKLLELVGWAAVLFLEIYPKWVPPGGGLGLGPAGRRGPVQGSGAQLAGPRRAREERRCARPLLLRR
jgi:hypothetical protein